MRLRRLFFFGILILGIVLGGWYCMGSLSGQMVKQDDPQRVAEAAVLAMEIKDIEKVVRYFTPVPGRVMASMLTRTFGNFETIVIQNLVVDVILNEGSSARVRAVFNMALTRGGFTDTQYCNKVIKLVKIDGKWWINEAF